MQTKHCIQKKRGLFSILGFLFGFSCFWQIDSFHKRLHHSFLSRFDTWFSSGWRSFAFLVEWKTRRFLRRPFCRISGTITRNTYFGSVIISRASTVFCHCLFVCLFVYLPTTLFFFFKKKDFIWKKTYPLLPNKGVEPSTSGLKGRHSTNWVNSVLHTDTTGELWIVIYKKKGLTGIRTQVKGFKVLGAKPLHYKTTLVGGGGRANICFFCFFQGGCNEREKERTKW